MKLWSHICFLVLATSSRSKGQEAVGPTGTKDPDPTSATTTVGEQNGTLASSQSPSLENEAAATAPNSGDNQPQLLSTGDNYAKENHGNGTGAATSLSPGGTLSVSWRSSAAAAVTTDASMTTSGSKPVSDSPTSEDVAVQSFSSGGYVLLGIIVVLIVALCVILYMLRRSSRTYSFDLQRPLPLSYASEPTGTFEPVRLDDLEPPARLDDVVTDDLPPPSIGNGTTAQPEENSSNAPVDANGLGPCPVSPPVSDQSAANPLDSVSLLSSGTLEEPQNENNNNPCKKY